MTDSKSGQPPQDTILFAGLPTAGKTSYLAALWYAIRRTKRPPELTLARLPPNLEFLNRIMEAWLSCREVDHTSTGATAETVLGLRLSNGPPLDLAIPDYSGEFVQQAWISRRWPAELGGYVRTARALILLVHPKHLHPHVTLEEAARNAAALEAGEPDSTLKPKPFDLKEVPSQTMLVEFVQFVRSRSKSKQLRVAVIVSAWDLAVAGETPEEWLAANMPLVDQFLRANADTLPSAVFGVSAQGSDWSLDRDSALARHPDERAFAVGPDGRPAKDVTAPVAWALTDS